MRSGLRLALLVCLTLSSSCQAWWFTNTTPAPSNGRPTFRRLWNAYPTNPPYTTLDLKDMLDLPNWLYTFSTPDSCSIRMSKAFHDIGLGIDRSRVRNCSTGSAEVDRRGKEYIIRVLFFRCYLRAIWGSPDRTGITSTWDIRGEKGVVIFSCGRLRHIDLWNGYTCALNCYDFYFTQCSTVEMYHLQ